MSRWWWQLEIQGDRAEELIFAIPDLEIQGTEVLNSNLLRVYLSAEESSTDLALLHGKLETFGLTLVSTTKVAERNWVLESQTSWPDIQIGELTVKFTPSPENAVQQNLDRRTLLVVPSMGFGTGEHETTRMMLELMQSPGIMAATNKSVLDVGTGSGILSIAAAKLYEASITAIEIDGQAVANASENIALNSFSEENIRLIHGDIKLAAETYDLILANIYAEVLLELKADLIKRLNPGGSLIISGILAEKEKLILAEFSENLTVQSIQRQGLWIAVSLRK
ncbi:50S ribosomal protein L11 methyltransferase [bacterium]|nr:50S ribosomal protein L11 methyltransferase [bacterium]